MSRCFPFPPPGYEKKARVDDADLLTKEKHKEKKQKEKKDKEKREGKEKKNEERSKEKQKEKKDRKEKQKEKKDKDREKDKNHTSADKRVEGKPEYPNGVKHVPNILQNAEIKDSKFVQDLARRIRDEDRTTGSQTTQNITVADERGAELSGRVVEGNVGDQSNKKEKMKHNGDNRKVNSLRNHVDARGLENTVVQRFSGLYKKSVEGKNVEEQMDGKKKSGEICVEARSLGKQNFPDLSGTDKKRVDQNARPVEEKKKSQSGVDARSLENAIVQEFSEMNKKRMERNAKQTEKIVEKQMEGNERNKLKESETKGDKHKDRDRKKKKKSKDKDRDKEKEKKERTKEKNEPSKKQPILIGSSKDTLETCIVGPSLLLASNKNSIGEGNLGKHKDSNMNGCILGNGILPNKLPRPISSSQPVMENGKIQPCENAICFEFEMQVIANNSEVDIKEHKVNGLIATPDTRPSSATVDVNGNGDTTKKRPHPDSHFLNQLLQLPKMEEWSDFDGQEWLFSDNQKSKKPKVDSPGSTREVWSEALQLEAADIYALPYVIPY